MNNARRTGIKAKWIQAHAAVVVDGVTGQIVQTSCTKAFWMARRTGGLAAVVVGGVVMQAKWVVDRFQSVEGWVRA